MTLSDELQNIAENSNMVTFLNNRIKKSIIRLSSCAASGNYNEPDKQTGPLTIESTLSDSRLGLSIDIMGSFQFGVLPLCQWTCAKAEGKTCKCKCNLHCTAEYSVDKLYTFEVIDNNNSGNTKHWLWLILGRASHWGMDPSFKIKGRNWTNNFDYNYERSAK